MRTRTSVEEESAASILPGELFVLFRVHVLAIEQEKISQADGLVKSVLRAEATGIHRDVQALVMGGLHQIEGELPARRGLAAAKGHAAAGVLVEEPVLADHFHDFFHGHDTAGHDARLVGTDFGTGAAVGALFRIAAHLAAFQRHHGAVGTDLRTGAAAHTQVIEQQHLRRELLRFGIAAPQAAQRTAFQKDRGPQAGTVLNGHPLDIVDHSLAHGVLPRSYNRRDRALADAVPRPEVI